MDTKIAPEVALRDIRHPLVLARSLPPPELARVGRNVSRFEQEAISVVNPKGATPFRPRIKIQARREESDLSLMYRVIKATAIAPNGVEVGQCQFYVCRRLRGRPDMDPDGIAAEMDHISMSVSNMAGALLSCDEWALYGCVNDTSLIVAERIEVQPEFRGSSLWRELFALSLRHSIEPNRDLPDYGYLKAFPLQFEDKAAGNEVACAEATQKLQHLYTTHLSARCVVGAEQHGCYMEFPIGMGAIAP